MNVAFLNWSESLMNIAVIGRGIIGLTTAITLQKEGHTVSILSREEPNLLVSEVAAAYWSPYRAEPREWGSLMKLTPGFVKSQFLIWVEMLIGMFGGKFSLTTTVS